MSITPDWLLRARNGLGPAIPPAALYAIMGSEVAGYAAGRYGDDYGSDGRGYGYGVGNGNGGYGDGFGDGGSGSIGYGCGWGGGGGNGYGYGNSVWPDPATYFEEKAE